MEERSEPQAELGQSERKRLTSKEIAENIKAGDKWLRSGPFGSGDSRWDQWKRSAKYLRCKWPDLGPNDIAYNSIFANYNTVRPTLFFKNPKIVTKPTGPAFQRNAAGEVIYDKSNRPMLLDNYKAARLLGIKLNYELKEIGFKDTLRRVVADVIAPFGVGWLKVGYQVMTVGGHSSDRDTKVSYWVSRVDPRNLVYHWNTIDSKQCLFFAERLIMTRSQAEDYGFKIPKGYTSRLPDFLKERSENVVSGREDDSMVIAWEYHDMTTRGIYWTLDVPSPDSAKEFPREPEFDPYPYEGASYIPIVFNDDNEDLIGVSDVEPVEDQAKAINSGRTKQHKHVEWYGTKTFYEDGAITEQEIEKTKVTDHGVYVKVAEGRLGAVKDVSPVSMGQDQYQMINEHKEDMRTTLGISEYQQASTGAASTRATVASIVQNAAVVRIEERKDRIHDAVVEVVRRLASMIQSFAPESDFLNLDEESLTEDFVEELKREFGFNPKIPFLNVPKDYIQGEYSYSFNLDDMIVQPKEVQFQQWTNFLQMVLSSPMGMQALEEEGVAFNKIVRKIAELGGVDLEEVKETGPAQISAEKENQMFLNNMEVPEPHKRDDHDEHNISHIRLRKELEGQLQGIQAEIQQKLQSMQQFSAALDPNNLQSAQMAQQAEQQIQAEVDGRAQEIESIQILLRRVSLHMQNHEEMRIKKEGVQAQGPSGLPGGPMTMPQGAQQQQVDIRQQAATGGM